MASGGKRKTTMAKLARESKLREKRAAKQARKTARKLEAANPSQEPHGALHDELAGSTPEGAEPTPEGVGSPAMAAAEPPSDA